MKAAPTPLGPDWEGKKIDGLIKPSIATVEVERILYGATDQKQVNRSAQGRFVPASALSGAYPEMDAGKRYIFILPAKVS